MEINKRNFYELAKYLLSGDLKMDFTMEVYKTTSCGTAGCALGHAPLVPTLPKLRTIESYDEYANRVFFNELDGDYEEWDEYDFEVHETVWCWCFDPDWSYVDNTPEGAAKRILYLITYGDVPDEYEHTRPSFKMGPYVALYSDMTIEKAKEVLGYV